MNKHKTNVPVTAIDITEMEREEERGWERTKKWLLEMIHRVEGASQVVLVVRIHLPMQEM